MDKRLSSPLHEYAAERYCLLACEVLFREISNCASRSAAVVDAEFVSQGWHDLKSHDMSAKLQAKIDGIDESKYSAVLLGFGLCNNGVAGLRARGIPLVIPRVHDCISLILGSHDAYISAFSESPGTYYFSSGWIERDKVNKEDAKDGVMASLGLDLSYEQYVEAYGKENADFIVSTIRGGMDSYEKLVFVNNGLGDVESYRNFARKCAEAEQLRYEEIPGNLRLLDALLAGSWSEADFLRVPPGMELLATGGPDIMRCSSCGGGKIC